MNTYLRNLAVATRDPGGARFFHALKTIIAGLIAYLILLYLNEEAVIYGIVIAGILMQCNAGDTPRQERLTMLIGAVAALILGPLANWLGHANIYWGYAFAIVLSFFAHWVVRYGGRYMLMPRFIYLFVMYCAVRPQPNMGLTIMMAVGISYVCALVIYALVLPNRLMASVNSSMHLSFDRLAEYVGVGHKHDPYQRAFDALEQTKDLLDRARMGRRLRSDLLDVRTEICFEQEQILADLILYNDSIAALKEKPAEVKAFEEELILALHRCGDAMENGLCDLTPPAPLELELPEPKPGGAMGEFVHRANLISSAESIRGHIQRVGELCK